MKKTVCVTGGSGGIGQNLIKHLLDSFHVKALFRKESSLSAYWEKLGCKIILGDLRDDASLIKLVSDTEYVFHCAAITFTSSPQEANLVNVEGTRKLAMIAANSGCKRFIHISSAAVYAGAELEAVACTEELEIGESPDMDLYALTKIRAEKALKAVAETHHFEYVILRPTCVYGPAVPSFTLMPFQLVQKGIPYILKEATGVVNVVYVDDVVRAISLAANSQDANGEIFNIGGETIAWKEFHAYYSRFLQKPVRYVPERIANLIVNTIGARRELRKFLKRHFSEQKKSTQYSSKKAEQGLGYRPKHSLEIGMLKTELWLRKNGHIQTNYRSLRSANLLYSLSPSTVVHPTSEKELSQIVQEASLNYLRIKTIGALHSHAPIPSTDGICIVLDKYKRVVSIDVENALITVQAGMKIWELNEILAKHRLALPILGTIDKQTVSGAISTGTHGGSLYHKSLSGYVQALSLVKADGSTLEIDRSQEIFNAVAVSIGLLGIISTVTFRCVPAFSLESNLSKISAQDLLQNFDSIHRGNKYVDIRYSPIRDNAQVVTINPATNDFDENGGWHPTAKTKIERRLLKSINMFGLNLFSSHSLNWLKKRATQKAEDAIYTSPYGQSDFVLTRFDAAGYDAVTSYEPDDLIPLSDMEIAISYSQAQAALTRIRDYFQTTQRYPTLTIHIRCTAADDFWLSPAYGQDICWIEFWEYPRTGELFREMIHILKPFNFRCHWGKQIPVEPGYLKQQYDKWSDFLELRRAWDPDLMFSNACLEHYFEL